MEGKKSAGNWVLVFSRIDHNSIFVLMLWQSDKQAGKNDA